jgi:hypothetical protein
MLQDIVWFAVGLAIGWSKASERWRSRYPSPPARGRLAGRVQFLSLSCLGWKYPFGSWPRSADCRPCFPAALILYA